MLNGNIKVLIGCFLLVECGGKLGIVVLEEEAEEEEGTLERRKKVCINLY